MSTYTHDESRVESINIGTSPSKLTRAQLEAIDADLRARLKADGWLTGHEVYRTEEDQTLHGGKTQAKKDVSGKRTASCSISNVGASTILHRTKTPLPPATGSITSTFVRRASIHRSIATSSHRRPLSGPRIEPVHLHQPATLSATCSLLFLPAIALLCSPLLAATTLQSDRDRDELIGRSKLSWPSSRL